jgi:hypothetical protein
MNENHQKFVNHTKQSLNYHHHRTICSIVSYFVLCLCMTRYALSRRISIQNSSVNRFAVSLLGKIEGPAKKLIHSYPP